MLLDVKADKAAAVHWCHLPRTNTAQHTRQPGTRTDIDSSARLLASACLSIRGTFILTTEPAMLPRTELEAELKKRGIDNDKFVTLKHGETIRLK